MTDTPRTRQLIKGGEKEKLMSQRKAHLLNLLRLDAPDFLIATHCYLLLRGYCDEDSGKVKRLIEEKMGQ
jgi:hypothetical protein